jgi:hypothetical protein
VTCLARVEPAQPFLLVEKRARAAGREVVDSGTERFEAGGEARWTGPAVLDTTVTFHARVGSGVLRGEASFAVEARRWPRLQLAGAVAPWDYGRDDLFGGWPPRARGDGLVEDGTLSVFVLSLAAPQVAYADEGPDARWLYVDRPARPPVGRVFVSRALRPGDAFYDAQRGGGDRLRPFCTREEMEQLARRLLQHEGAARSDGPSHFSESQRAFAERDLQAELESQTLFYDDAVVGPTLGERLDTFVKSALRRIRTEQDETVDHRAPVHIGCLFARP